MGVPIVMAAFGTTTRAMSTYTVLDGALRAVFPEHEIHWAYTSRMVKERLKARHDHPSPGEALDRLDREGHSWAVVQSVLLVCGHEFYRLAETAGRSPVRCAMGLPLLTSPEDCHAMALALTPLFEKDPEEAVALVGHGTDHPAWSMYTALGWMLREIHGPRAFVGVVEEGYPPRGRIVEDVVKNGFRAVRLAPLLLAAGVHFSEDLVSGGDSWKSAFETRGLHVRLETEGIGANPGVAALLAGHVRQALDICEGK